MYRQLADALMPHLAVEENFPLELMLLGFSRVSRLFTLHVFLFNVFPGRFPKAVLVVPLALLELERCGDFLHPSGP